MKKESAEARPTPEQDASTDKSVLIFANFTTLPAALAMLVIVGICKWLRLPGEWTLGIMAAVFLAILTFLIVLGCRQRRN